MLTAKASEEERVAGFALGADDYVVQSPSVHASLCIASRPCCGGSKKETSIMPSPSVSTRALL